MLLEISGEITPERRKRRSQSKINTQLWMRLVTEARSDAKKEQYSIGTMNIRFMNQSKWEIVKQETARLYVDVLGISEIKWTGIGEFNPDDHLSTTVGKNQLEEME